MIRSRAMTLGAFAATGTFCLTLLAVWAMTQGQTRTNRAAAPQPAITEIPKLRPTPESSPDNLRDTNDVRVYRAVKDAVVNITSTHTITQRLSTGNSIIDQFPPEMLPVQLRPQERQVQLQSLGSGFVIHSAGYIITNEHVIEQGTDIQCVFVNGTKLAATVIATDNEHDLAVLKVNPPTPLPALALGASEDLMIGEPVYAIGNPFGFAGTMTRGIVSALDRSLDVSKEKSYKGLIQTDASINPGNSGGPLLNAYGQVIGINTAIRADAQGIGFAIAVSNMRDLLPAFLNPEALNRAQVGFTVEEVRSIQTPASVAAAVIVKQVQPNSDAAKAGVKAGDKLVRIGNIPVNTIVDALVPIASANPGDTLSLKFLRIHGDVGSANTNTPIEATIAVTKPPVPPADEILLAKMGVKAQTVTPAMATSLKLVINQGIYINTVTPGSPAAVAGIQPGDVLFQLDRYRIASTEDVATLLKTVKDPVSPFIAVMRANALGRGTISLK